MAGNKNKAMEPQNMAGVGSVNHEKSMLVYMGVTYRFPDIENVARFEEQARFIKSNCHHDLQGNPDQPERTGVYSKVFKIEVGGVPVDHSAHDVIEILKMVKLENYIRNDRPSGY